ncbi:Ankyrin [Plasmopara halstedii]|uniref:Ankyrin n=1 Tax=Plasmopara halstedii TaxID=4781 RepID=A0A0P1A5M5_PLAHL|nr:Ankyrin [Plasmopara halstedii]CEG35298.1 Ankyrin [Plasmopara halstedii]|eukprot:XP_024571667.1 Ankyrin [Plasmopara halstedii]
MKRSFQNLYPMSEIVNDITFVTDNGLVASEAIATSRRAWKRRVFCPSIPSAVQIKSTFLPCTTHLTYSQMPSLPCQWRCGNLETALKEEALLCLVLSFLNVREHQIIRQTNRSWQRRVQTLVLDRLDLSYFTSPVCTHTLDRACQGVLASYSRIRRLDLSGQRALVDRDLLVLTSCFWSHLEEIVVDDCQEISDFGLLAVLNAQSLRLRSVSVRRCKRVIGDLFFTQHSPLHQLTGSHPSLTTLNLDDTNVTYAFISRVEAHFPMLQRLSALHTPAHRTFFQQIPVLNSLLREMQLLVSNELDELVLSPVILDEFTKWRLSRHGNKVGVFERTIVANGLQALLDVPLLLTSTEDSTDDIEGENSVLISLLLHACVRGKIRLLSSILAVGRNGIAFDLENTDADGHSPLSLAVSNGFVEATRMLLQAGSNIETRSLSLVTPLYRASEHGWDGLVDMLLDANARRDCSTTGGATALCVAAKNGHRSTVLRLLAAEKQAEDEVQVRGRCNKYQLVQALFLACEGGHLFVVSDLLLLTELNANVLMNDNVSPLYLACQMGYEDIVLLLLERGGNPSFQRPQGGVSCLYIAAQEGHNEIVRMLILAGANVNAKMNDMSTALHIAARMGRKTVSQTLLSYGARLNDQTRSGLTALYIASEEGHTELVQCLLNLGAARDIQTSSGATALFAAVHRGHNSVVEMLLLHGANTSVSKYNGASPLDAAVMVGNTNIARLLLRFGARVGGLALHFAERRQNIGNLHALLQASYSSQQLFQAIETRNQSTHTLIAPTKVDSKHGKTFGSV